MLRSQLRLEDSDFLNADDDKEIHEDESSIKQLKGT